MKFVTIIFERRLDNVLTEMQTLSYKMNPLIITAAHHSEQRSSIKLIGLSESGSKQFFNENEFTRLPELIRNEAVDMQEIMSKKTASETQSVVRVENEFSS